MGFCQLYHKWKIFCETFLKFMKHKTMKKLLILHRFYIYLHRFIIVITVCTKYDIMSTKLNVDNDNDKTGLNSGDPWCWKSFWFIFFGQPAPQNTKENLKMYRLIFNGINLKMNKYIKNWKIKFHMQLYIYFLNHRAYICVHHSPLLSPFSFLTWPVK